MNILGMSAWDVQAAKQLCKTDIFSRTLTLLMGVAIAGPQWLRLVSLMVR